MLKTTLNKPLFILGLFSSFVLLFLSVGCNNTVNSTGGTALSNGASYFPNQNGYSWTYKVSAFSSLAGPLTTTEVTVTTSESVFVDGTREINGTTTQRFKHTGYSSYETYYALNNYGLFSYGTNMVTLNSPETILAFPLQVGKTWLFGSQSVEVQAIENVTVPKGTYSCFKIKTYVDVDSFIYSYFAENIGLVKQVSLISNLPTYNSQGQVLSTYTIFATYELTSKNF